MTRFRFQLVEPGEIYPLSNITLRPAAAVRMIDSTSPNMKVVAAASSTERFAVGDARAM